MLKMICEDCGAEYSATYGDYSWWSKPDDEQFTCECGGKCVLSVNGREIGPATIANMGAYERDPKGALARARKPGEYWHVVYLCPFKGDQTFDVLRLGPEMASTPHGAAQAARVILHNDDHGHGHHEHEIHAAILSSPEDYK